MDSENRKKLGVRLRAERERLGYTQPQFAELGDVSVATLQNWERGANSPNADFLAVTADHGLDVAYVVSGKSLRRDGPAPGVVEGLAAAGIRWGENFVELSPGGLVHLLNYVRDVADGSLRWGGLALTELAKYRPAQRRAGTVQTVELRPYGDQRYHQVIVYLDKSPPAIPWSLLPAPKIESRYELDLGGFHLPILLPDSGFPSPVICFSDSEVAQLEAKGSFRVE